MVFLRRVLAVGLPVPVVLAGWFVGASTDRAAPTAILAAQPDRTQEPGTPPASVSGDRGVGVDAAAPDTATAGAIAPGVAPDDVVDVGRTAASGDIPPLALAAYQRTGAVIDRADGSCNLSWQLVAAIGRVESDHGRHGGSTLDENGVARPGIFGLPLDGQNGTRAITDTDAGHHDGDTEWDRAVGPMQFIPSTWSYVAVDGDGDGVRDPQDIDDATLAAGVYLCSGGEDLSTQQGLRDAVHRYNASDEYVDLVLEIMAAYTRTTASPTISSINDLEAIPLGEPHRPDAGETVGKDDSERTGKQRRAADHADKQRPGKPRTTPPRGARKPPSGEGSTDDSSAARPTPEGPDGDPAPKQPEKSDSKQPGSKQPDSGEPEESKEPPQQQEEPPAGEEPTTPAEPEPTPEPEPEPTPEQELPACPLETEAFDPASLDKLAPAEMRENPVCEDRSDTDSDGLPDTPEG